MARRHHTLASHAVTSGIPLPIVARLPDHSRCSMTLRCAHVRDRDMEAAAKRTGAAVARPCDLSDP